MPDTPGNGFSAKYSMIIQTVLIVMAVFGAGWAGVFSPMLHNIEKLQVDASADRVWTAKQDVQILKLEAAIDRIDLRFTTQVVPRREQEANKVTVDATLKLLAERLNELRRDTYQTVTVSDDLKRLQADITELRKQLSDRK